MKHLLLLASIISFFTSCTDESTVEPLGKWHVFQNWEDTTRGMVISEDYVYIAYQNHGLGRVSKHTLEQQYFTPLNSEIPTLFTTCVDMDADGNVWVGTGKGLSKFNGTTWVNFDHFNSPLPNAPVQDIECDDLGIVWVATYHGLYKKDGESWDHYDLSSGLTDTLLRKVKEIDGKIYVGGTVGGFSVLNNGIWENFNTINSALEDNQIRCLEPDVDGSFWASSFWSFYHVNGTTFEVYNENNTGISHPWVNDIAIAENGTKHFATHVGYSIWNLDGSWSKFLADSTALPHNIVEMVNIDKNGNVWLGTFGGLAIYNDHGIQGVY